MSEKTEELRKALLRAPKNGYDRINAEERVELERYCKNYMKFIDAAKTEREAVSATIEMAEDAGFGVVRDWIGHGVGRTVHEDPEVPNYGKPGTKLVLKPGMTIAIEPMITLGDQKTYVDKSNGWTVITRDHCYAAHFEHTVAITDDGCEVLTLPADYP